MSFFQNKQQVKESICRKQEQVGQIPRKQALLWQLAQRKKPLQLFGGQINSARNASNALLTHPTEIITENLVKSKQLAKSCKNSQHSTEIHISDLNNHLVKKSFSLKPQSVEKIASNMKTLNCIRFQKNIMEKIENKSSELKKLQLMNRNSTQPKQLFNISRIIGPVQNQISVIDFKTKLHIENVFRNQNENLGKQQPVRLFPCINQPQEKFWRGQQNYLESKQLREETRKAHYLIKKVQEKKTIELKDESFKIQINFAKNDKDEEKLFSQLFDELSTKL